tara:strand:+ start:1536 stop:3677 length:2142 start_codon:yes stop_codon:yes gene_type:complete
MISLQLYIEGHQVELHENESVVLKQTLKDVQDLEKVFTDYTRTFNVPASRVNNILFKHAYNFNIQGFDARSKKPATLHLNYAPFKVGNIKLEGVQMKDNVPINYRITFFGNMTSLKDIFKDDELGLLQPLAVSGTNSNSFLYTANEVSTLLQDGKSFIINGETIPKALVAPLISHTDRLYYNSNQDTAGTFNLHYGTSSKGVLYNQLKPAISIYTLLRAIEENYNIQFSTDFINSTNENITKLYMWLHRKKGSLLEEGSERLYSIYNYENITSGIFGGNFGTYGFINGTVDGGINRFIQIKVSTASSVKYKVLLKEGNNYPHTSEHTGNSIPISFNDNFELFSQPGLSKQQFQLAIETSEAAIFDIEFFVKDVASNRSGTSSATKQITTSSLFSFNVLNELPKIKVMDFLTGVFKMFNLVSYFENDVIKVLPLDDFYASSTKTYDITKYLDKGTSEVNTVLPFSLINFKYQEAKTLLAYNHNKQFNIEWGNLSYKNPGISEGVVYNVQLPFENLKFERLLPSSIQYGYSVDSKLDPYIGKPFIFYADKIENAEPVSFLSVAGGTAASIPKYFVPSNSVKVKEDSNTINFGAEQSEWLATNFDKSLYKTHYDNFIKGAFSKSRRLSKFKAYVPMSVISNLKLEDKIIVFSNLYKINTLTTNFATGLSSFELINETIDFKVTANQNDSDQGRTVDSTILTVDSTLVTVDNAIQRI